MESAPTPDAAGLEAAQNLIAQSVMFARAAGDARVVEKAAKIMKVLGDDPRINGTWLAAEAMI